jgi:hypothetical protein
VSSSPIARSLPVNSLDTMKRLTLELGGKSPNIILDDADFSTAIPMAVAACYLNMIATVFDDSRMTYQPFRPLRIAIKGLDYFYLSSVYDGPFHGWRSSFPGPQSN